MNGLLNYLLQMGAISAVLYGYYHFILRNKKFHYYNRYYLLAAVLLSILIPFVNIPIYFTEQQTSSSGILHTLTIFSSGNADNTVIVAKTGSSPFTVAQILYTVYIAVGILLLARIIVSLIKINRIYRHNQVEQFDKIFLIYTNEPGTPFSFFRWLFWNRDIEMQSGQGQQIFRHELYHIREKHSYDVLFMELLTTMLWFNPFFHLMKKELRAIHEFLADQAAANKNEEWNYAELLLMQVLNTNKSLVNPFFHNQIKRRIAMITSSQKPKHQYLRKVMVLPIIVLLTMLFAFTYKEIKRTNLLLEADKSLIVHDTIPGNKLTPVEVSGNLLIPSTYKVKPDLSHVEFYNNKGQIIFKADSIVFKTDPKNISQSIPKALIVINGNVQAENFSINEHTVIAREATVYGENDPLAVKKYGPTAARGVIEFKDAYFSKTGPIKEVTVKGHPLGEPMVVLDGVIEQVVPGQPMKEVLDKVQPENIKSINILKDKSATTKYGEKGVNGVIEIETKKGPVAGILEETITDTVARNLVFEKAASEPSFPGGINGWRKFLERNLDAGVPLDKGAPAGKYTVRARFVVDKTGKIYDLHMLTNFGYGMEDEVKRVISKGPDWVPAVQNGRKVNAYREQPVTFIVTDELEIKEDEIKEVREVSKNQLPEVVVVGYPSGKTVKDDKGEKGVKGDKGESLQTLKLEPTTSAIYPNPADNIVQIPLSSTKAGTAVVQLINSAGNISQTQRPSLGKGQNTLSINTASLQPGYYTIKISLPDGGGRSYKMIKK